MAQIVTKCKQQRTVPTMTPNGNSPQVPDDIVWDDDNPPVLYECSNMLFHNHDCDKQCGEMQVTEARVRLINEGLAWSRAGMRWRGIPSSYANVLPVNGINVELTDALIWLELLRDKLIELTGSNIEDFDEEFATAKYEKLHEMRMEAEDRVRKQRIADSLGVVEKRLLGPDGQPL